MNGEVRPAGPPGPGSHIFAFRYWADGSQWSYIVGQFEGEYDAMWRRASPYDEWIEVKGDDEMPEDVARHFFGEKQL